MSEANATLSWTVKRLTDVIWVREAALTFAEAQGLGRREAWGLAIALSELTTNAVKFAGGGDITLRACASEARRGLEIVVEDRGPGIADPEAALIDGYSEGHMLSPDSPLHARHGLGCGLGAVRRLMDELQMEGREGGGTRVVARRWQRSARSVSE
jgi:serine/threonine-protein kinase RsbT